MTTVGFPRHIQITALLTALLVCSAGTATGRTLQQVRNTGEIRVGVALAAPWAARDRDGEFIGYEIDIANTLAADLGVESTFVVYELDELTTALEIGEVDIVIASLPISPTTALQINFSNPHTSGGLTLATHLASTRSVGNLADLDSGDYSLAVVADSVAVDLAKRLLPRMRLRTFPTADEAGQALVDGTVDAYLEEEPGPTYLALEHPSRIDVPIARALLQTQTGFAIAKGDGDFLAYLNAWIVARRADTWLPTTHDYWFRSLRWRDRLSQVPEF